MPFLRADILLKAQVPVAGAITLMSLRGGEDPGPSILMFMGACVQFHLNLDGVSE